jgi:dipeptidyl aminopeptidase/acylaminoacyl peptidase
LDADECIDMLNQVISEKLCDPKKVFAVGGSYGGYLSGIMGSRFSEYFKGVVLLNPVVNLMHLPMTSGIKNDAQSFKIFLNGHYQWLSTNFKPGT